MIIKDCKKLYKNLPKHSDSAGGYYKDSPLILNGCSSFRNPQFNAKEIRFNGGSVPLKNRVQDNQGYWSDSVDTDLGHETFFLHPKIGKTSDGFDSCKTARKPYDLMVKACLLICKEYLGDDIEISSDEDSDPDNWKPAIAFIYSTLERIAPDSFSKLVG
jgi:hypothetical protein